MRGEGGACATCTAQPTDSWRGGHATAVLQGAAKDAPSFHFGALFKRPLRFSRKFTPFRQRVNFSGKNLEISPPVFLFAEIIFSEKFSRSDFTDFID